MQKKIYFLFFIPALILVSNFVNAQCSVAITDSLYNDFSLHLTATPTSGVPPFTYAWTITGSTTGSPVTPAHLSVDGDTAIISANDLFANYGCIIINLCFTDSAGCTNCMGDTAFTNAVVCYSAFNWQETQPGQMQIMLNNPVPEFIGLSIISWTQSGSNFTNLLMGGFGTFTYTPDQYNPNGYDVPVCVQTFFNNTSYMCIACDTVHFSAATPLSSNAETADNLYRLPLKTTTGSLQIFWNGNTEASCAVLDLSGREVLNTLVKNGAQYLDTQALAAGVYLLRIQYGGKVFTEKIVKQ